MTFSRLLRGCVAASLVVGLLVERPGSVAPRIEHRPEPDVRVAVRGRRGVARDFILATLFYEPSTRTRLPSPT